jgi:ABC-type nitrate/sulfonate/bicarbonate transport system ATPase subunit
MTMPNTAEIRHTAAPKQPFVVAENVRKTFTKVIGDEVKQVDALSSLNFHINEGEFITIVGPSGCGKTTLLRIVAGLTEATSGRVIINGKVVTKPSPERAIVFQDFLLLPWRTCLDNVAFGLELQGMSKKERFEKANAALSLVGLDGWGSYYPNELSGGMQQRVGIARALAVDPEILLMDEPFGSLDAISRSQMQYELMQIFTRAKEQKTVLFVTHSIDEALLLADRIFVMAEGGRMIDDIKLHFGRPRSQAELLSNAEYIEIKRHLLEQLQTKTATTLFSE